MFKKRTLRWPPELSTVIGLGILASSICNFVTGNLAWAGIAAAVKFLVQDNSTAAGRVIEAIADLTPDRWVGSHRKN